MTLKPCHECHETPVKVLILDGCWLVECRCGPWLLEVKR